MKIYSNPIPVPEWRGIDDIELYRKDVEKHIEDTQEWARTNRSGNNSDIVGEVIYQPYADGHAVYVVAELEGRVGLIHLEVDDAWSDPQFERLVTVGEIRRMLDQQAKLDNLFGRKKEDNLEDDAAEGVEVEPDDRAEKKPPQESQ